MYGILGQRENTIKFILMFKGLILQSVFIIRLSLTKLVIGTVVSGMIQKHRVYENSSSMKKDSNIFA